MPTDAKSPSQVIGERLRAIRTGRDQRQDEVAAEARSFGLPWTRATIAAIETGRRAISLEELFLLPWIYDEELPRLIALALSASPGPVRVAPGVDAPSRLLRAVFEGKALTHTIGTWGEDPSPESTDLAERLMARVVGSRRLTKVWPGASEEEVLAAARDAAGEVERRSAQRLGIEPFALALAARRRWQHSLTEERDRRAPEGQTSRGHITRALLEELRPDLEAAGLLSSKGR